ncbi:MAG: hypothetical protein AAF564_07515, partial [Bacteroidota bacterium]
MFFNTGKRRGKGMSAPLVLGLLLVFAAGCDSLPEQTDALSRPPEVSNLSYSPRQLDLGTAPAGSVVNGTARVDFSISAEAADPDGTVSSVRFVLRPPTVGSDPLTNVEMEPQVDGTYVLNYTQELNEGETGDYTLELYAVDNAGTLSNRVLGTFTLLNVQDPPVIEAIEAPATVTRPAEGTTAFQLIATVSDPQGVANVASVLAWNVINPQATFGLFDDGAGGDDEVAGDGRFTATVQISSSNAPGVNTIAFQATDRSGLRS